MKDLRDSSTICRKKGKYNERDKTGKRFITAFQLFKILMDSVDSLITPMELTDAITNTQFHGKVDGYKTLEHNTKELQIRSIRRTRLQITIRFSLILEPLQMVLNMGHILLDL